MRTLHSMSHESCDAWKDRFGFLFYTTYQERCGHRGQEKEEKQRRQMLGTVEKTFIYLEIAGSWMGVR